MARRASFRLENKRRMPIWAGKSVCIIYSGFPRGRSRLGLRCAVCGLQVSGPGMLVHPTRGTLMVACRSIKVSDKIEEEAGQTYAEMEFVEANLAGGVSSGNVLFGIISSNLNAVSRDSFLRDYRPVQLSQPWRADVINTAQRLVDAVAKVTVQTMPVNASTQAWRDALKIQEVAQDDGLASIATNVETALNNGFIIIAENISDPVHRVQGHAATG